MHLSTTFTLTLISLLVDQTPYEVGTVRTVRWLAQVCCHELVTVYSVNFSSQCALSTSLAPALRVLLENSTKRFYRRTLVGGKRGRGTILTCRHLRKGDGDVNLAGRLQFELDQKGKKVGSKRRVSLSQRGWGAASQSEVRISFSLPSSLGSGFSRSRTEFPRTESTRWPRTVPAARATCERR